MIDLQNNLTLTFVWLIHNFQDGSVDLKFRVLPTTNTIVTSSLSDWEEFTISITDTSPAYATTIGLSQADVQAIIINQWVKYQTYKDQLLSYNIIYDQYLINFAQWEIDVVGNPGLQAPVEPIIPTSTHAIELTLLFDYVYSIGIK